MKNNGDSKDVLRCQQIRFVASSLGADEAIDTVSSRPTDLKMVADCVVWRLRSGACPDARDAELLNHTPLIEAMREAITDGDLSWVLAGVRADGDARDALFTSLLRRHAQRPEVQERLRSIWQVATPYMQSHVLWRMLDDPALSQDWHAQLFDFVQTEWALFETGVRKFLGADDELILARAINRFGDPAFPETKKWVYLCSAATAASYPHAVRALLSLGAVSEQSFTRNVAGVLAKGRL
jgi:hypothetical protein